MHKEEGLLCGGAITLELTLSGSPLWLCLYVLLGSMQRQLYGWTFNSPPPQFAVIVLVFYPGLFPLSAVMERGPMPCEMAGYKSNK